MIAAPRSRLVPSVLAIASAVAAVVGIVGVGWARTAAAESLVVLPASGEGLSTAIVTWSREHLVHRLTLHGQGRVGVIDEGGPPTREPIGAAAAVAAARSVGATRAVTLHLAHLRDETWLTLTSYASNGDAQPVRLTEHLTAGPEWIPATIDRMATALLFPATWMPAPTASTSQVPYVSSRRAPRETFVGLGVGGQVAFNTADRDDLWLPSGSVLVMKVTATWMLDARMTHAAQSEAYATSLGVGVYRPFFADDTTRSGVFVGAGARWAWVRLGGRSADGPAIHPSVGYLHRLAGGPFLRADLAYVVNLFAEQQPDRLIPGSGDRHYSHGPAVTLAVVF